MISVSGKKWSERSINKNSVDKIKQEYGFSDILAKLIVSRKFNKTEIFNINNDLEITNKFLNNKDYVLASNILTNSWTSTTCVPQLLCRSLSLSPCTSNCQVMSVQSHTG